MKKFKERKEVLANGFGAFTCLCELCQYEKNLTTEDEIYEQYQKLREILQNHADCDKSGTSFQNAISRCISISCCIQMYNLAKMKNSHKYFILYDIILPGHMIATMGYMNAKRKKDHGKRKYFKEECQKLSKVGYEIAKRIFGIDSVGERKWKEIHQNFEKFVREYGKDLNNAYKFFA